MSKFTVCGIVFTYLVTGIGTHRGWGRQFEEAQNCAILDAQKKCNNTQVKQFSSWSLSANCHEGVCTRQASADFECLDESAIFVNCLADEI